MLLFYAPDILSQPVLPEQESHHCIKVLRKQVGDFIDITDGKGRFFKAQIEEADARRCQVLITQVIETQPLSVRIEIAVSPTKSPDRMEWMAEKLTELGVDGLTFLRTRYGERRTLNLDRLRKILIAAMKQSEKAVVPELGPFIDFETYVNQPFAGQKIIPHCYPATPKPLLSRFCRKAENARILIGPEGDFSEEEVSMALQQGYQAVSLGNTRLRTETAALTACQTVHIINQLG